MSARVVNPDNWGYRPTSAFLFTYNDQSFEADTPGQIMTELTGTYMQDANALSRWHLRGKLARQWLNRFAVDEHRAEIWSGDRQIENNYTPRHPNDPEDVEAYAGLEWNDEPVAKIDIQTDRTFLNSLLELGLITILEREDVHYFRRTPSWERSYAAGRTKCQECRFYRLKDEGEGRCIDKAVVVSAESGQIVDADAPIGWFCQSFAPLHAEDRLEDGRGAQYFTISPADIHFPDWQLNFIEE